MRLDNEKSLHERVVDGAQKAKEFGEPYAILMSINNERIIAQSQDGKADLGMKKANAMPKMAGLWLRATDLTRGNDIHFVDKEKVTLYTITA